MRQRAVGVRVALVVMAVVLGVVGVAAAIRDRPEPASAGAGPTVMARPPLAFVRAGDSLVTVDVEQRAVAVTARGAVSSLDGAELFRTRRAGAGTELEAVDPRTGAVRWRRPVANGLVPRVASFDGSLVALMAPAPAATGGYPEGRATTDLVVAGRDGRPQRHHLRGNLEPEAFGLDGRHLYLIQYVPATAPTGYKVRRMDLATGRVGPVPSPDIAPDTVMGGSARAQVMAPDGSRLYTLYSVPAGVPDGLHGTDPAQGRAFVHVLDLAEGWAHCLLLPAPIGVTSLADGPIAVSPDGAILAVFDAAVEDGSTSFVAVDTELLDPGPLREVTGLRWPVAAAIDDDGALYASGVGGAGRPRVQVLDLEGGGSLRRWGTRTPVVSMSAVADGSLLLAEPDRARVVVMRPGGDGGRALPLPQGGPVAVGPASVTLPGPRDVLECAC